MSGCGKPKGSPPLILDLLSTFGTVGFVNAGRDAELREIGLIRVVELDPFAADARVEGLYEQTSAAAGHTSEPERRPAPRSVS